MIVKVHAFVGTLSFQLFRPAVHSFEADLLRPDTVHIDNIYGTFYVRANKSLEQNSVS